METIVRKERTAEPPYSLHDAYLMELVPEGDSVRLCFQGGYLRVEDTCQVDGDVRITGVDWTFCHAYVLEYQDVLCGNFGSFTGRKMPITEFLERYPGGTVDVMDEMYGYNQAWISGFLNYGSKCFEIQLEFSYDGDFCYLLRE